ncbi:MAG: T9SS type A sorting domain-containing protein, partial [Chitinophagales bacterium]
KLADDITASLELGENEIGVYPNPVNSSATMQLYFTANNAGDYNIKVVDINGRVVSNISQHFESGDQQLEIETAVLSDGMYFISVSDGLHSASTKFIKIK